MNKRSRKYFVAKKPQKGGVKFQMSPNAFDMRGLSRIDRIKKRKSFWRNERNFWRAKAHPFPQSAIDNVKASIIGAIFQSSHPLPQKPNVCMNSRPAIE